MVATGASGTTTVRYGAMRENVLSLLVVTADGERRAHPLARAQVVRRLRPHAAVHRLGGHARPRSAEATLRVHPTPEAMAAAVCPFATLEGAVDCVDRRCSPTAIPVARIELADDAQIDAINRHVELDHEVAPDAVPRVPRRAGRGRGAGRRGRRRSRASTARAASRGRPTRPSAAGSGTPATRAYDAARATAPRQPGPHDRRLRPDLPPRRVHRSRRRRDIDDARPARADRRPRRRRQLPRRGPRRPRRPGRARARRGASTSASSAARSRWTAPARASTASATARRAFLVEEHGAGGASR